MAIYRTVETDAIPGVKLKPLASPLSKYFQTSKSHALEVKFCFGQKGASVPMVDQFGGNYGNAGKGTRPDLQHGVNIACHLNDFKDTKKSADFLSIVLETAYQCLLRYNSEDKAYFHPKNSKEYKTWEEAITEFNQFNNNLRDSGKIYLRGMFTHIVKYEVGNLFWTDDEGSASSSIKNGLGGLGSDYNPDIVWEND